MPFTCLGIVFFNARAVEDLEVLQRASIFQHQQASSTNTAVRIPDTRVVQGNEATFVVLDVSPLDDIRNTRLIHAVVRRGAVVDRDALRVR